MTKSFDIDQVLSQLTADEKIGLLAGIDFWHTYPVSRLNVPSIRLSDGPNGIRGTRFFDAVPGAVLPNGTGLASTFDQELLFRAGKLAAAEAKSKGAHIDLGPTSNIQRGPLGGRGFESFSEDPYLSGIASAEIIKGLQSEHIGATMKHYVCNDLEHERNSSDSILTERALREIYLEPFRLAIKNADPVSIMTSYNKVNGEHASQSKKLLHDVLREEYGWTGTIMSDWFGTYTSKESVENGLDLEMPGPSKARNKASMSQLLTSKEIHTKDLDARVRNVLKLVKYAVESGIPENAPESADNNTAETSALLREIGADSIVLLKNEDGLLPLKKDESIAVIGPNAKVSAYSGGGSASLRPYYKTTPYGGIAKKLGKDVPYAVGAYAHLSLPGLAELVTGPNSGKPGFELKFYHEPRSHKGDRRQFDQTQLDQSFNILFDYNHPEVDGVKPFYGDFEGVFVPEETGDYEFGCTVVGTAQLFVNGKLVVDNKTKQTKGKAFFSNGTIEEKGVIHLEKGEKYDILIEFGSGQTYTITAREGVDFTGNGAIGFGVAKVIDAQEEISKAVELAKSVDKVVLSIGTNGEWESEGYDRTHMDLPGRTDELVSAVLKANPNTVIVNQSGTPVTFPWVKEAKAIVQCWFGGNELGNAIADVLFGDVNPSGKLSLSWPFKLEDNPTYLNFHTERGRVLYGEDIFVGYRYYEKLQKQVAFPFGHGLSYTSFAFSDLKCVADEANDLLKLSLTVKNTGKLDGKEVVQVYISKDESDVIRPVKELKGFTKVALKAGESKTVDLDLVLRDSVSFFDEWQDQWSVQAGEYTVQVGPSSDEIELREQFTIKKSFFWSGL